MTRLILQGGARSRVSLPMLTEYHWVMCQRKRQQREKHASDG
jgi:hypothetical protein